VPSQPEAEVTSTGSGNVILFSQGTILRSWPATSTDTPPESILMGENGWTAKEGSNGPYELIFELPSSATIQQIVLGLGEWGTNEQVQPAPNQTAHVAVSSTSATSGFSEVGTYQLSGAEDQTINLTSPAKGRWIKLTVDGNAAGTHLFDVQFIGTFDPRPPAAPVAGLWKYYDGDPYPNLGFPKDAAGVFPTPPAARQIAPSDQLLEIHQSGSNLNAQLCAQGSVSALTGTEAGTVVNLAGADKTLAPAVVNADGTMMAGSGATSDTWLALRVRDGGSCDLVFAAAKPQGNGAPVLELYDTGDPQRYAPYGYPAVRGLSTVGPPLYPGYRIVPLPVARFDPQVLGGYQIAVLSAVCNASSVLTKTQAQALTDWVYSGGKLIIHDADDCTQTGYSFLPYDFTTSNPGKHGAGGTNFFLVESSTLGSDASDKAHFIDVKGYLAANNQLGDANTVVTQDKHWCGHLYGTNVLNQNGYFQMYAPLGQGLMIYDGLDNDDADIQQYQRILLLELQQPANATLPCGQPVATPFTVVQAGGGNTFAPGKPQTMTIPLSVLASHGFSGAVNLAVKAPPNAPWSTSLSNSKVPLNGASAQSNLTVNVPANAKPGSYPFVVTGTDAAGDTTSASVTIASAGAQTPAPAPRAASVPATPKIAKALATTKRVVVYGIYFDFASSTLKPESTPVLKEIADALRANPSWRLTIEGYTDNVGGVDYNLDLSRRRAAAVRSALIASYHIQGERLNTVGYGLSRPKASNDTAQGRALNRRVELVRS
jgi:outer membrane protein OmpA-like peptidoglycan-associated protein